MTRLFSTLSFVILLSLSSFSQEKLISICRESNIKLKKMINENKIFLLKKSAKEYANEIKLEHWKSDKKIKIIFGNKFKWH